MNRETMERAATIQGQFEFYRPGPDEGIKRAPLLTTAEFDVVIAALGMLAAGSPTEHDIHGLCPGHPIREGATCGHCNMSWQTLRRLCAIAAGEPLDPNGEGLDPVGPCLATTPEPRTDR